MNQQHLSVPCRPIKIAHARTHVHLNVEMTQKHIYQSRFSYDFINNHKIEADKL